MFKKLRKNQHNVMMGSLKIMTMMIITFFSLSAYAVALLPTIASITPASGPVAGGTNVTITGTNFTGTTAVTIGGAAATGFVVVSATSITATTPAGTAGGQNVAVTTGVGTATSVGLFTYVSSTTSNPALDANVQGQIAGQILSIQHFVKAQNSSLLSRLQRLHSGFTTGSSYSSQLMTPTTIQEALYAPESYLLASNSSDLPVALAVNVEGEHKVAGLWFGGDLSYGSINAEGVSNNRFTSGSLSIGIDHLLKNSLIIGAVAGFGWDTTKIGVQGTKTKTTTPSVSLYASYNPMNNTFIDGWLGYGRSALNNQRWESTDSVFVNGDRTANSYFGSLALSTAVKMSAINFKPFVRGDFLYSTLGSYNESGNSTRLLSYNTMKFNAISIVGGATASYDILTSTGVFTPLIETEYMQSNNVSTTQGLFFSNAASTAYSLGINSIPTNISTTKLGLQYQNNQGITAEIKVGFSKGNSSYISRVLNAQVNIPF